MATSNVVAQTRLKSSFIYLANAVNDLRGNWTTMGLVLAPIVVVASLCLLPDALNWQHALAVRFEPGVHNISYIPAQMPYEPSAQQLKPLFPAWALMVFHAVLVVVTLIVNLVVLCILRRIHSGVRHSQVLNEALEVYREAFGLIPAFLWIVILQVIATVIGFVLLIVPGVIALVWLYFSQYALVFDKLHSIPALFHSRDLMRRRFFKVASRIVVFLAVWSGFNSWVGGGFFIVSLLIGPIGVLTGMVWGTIFLLDLIATGVGFATTAFFIAAGVRLYQDLSQIAVEEAAVSRELVLPPTAPLPSLSAQG